MTILIGYKYISDLSSSSIIVYCSILLFINSNVILSNFNSLLISAYNFICSLAYVLNALYLLNQLSISLLIFLILFSLYSAYIISSIILSVKYNIGNSISIKLLYNKLPLTGISKENN